MLKKRETPPREETSVVTCLNWSTSRYRVYYNNSATANISTRCDFLSLRQHPSTRHVHSEFALGTWFGSPSLPHLLTISTMCLLAFCSDRTPSSRFTRSHALIYLFLYLYYLNSARDLTIKAYKSFALHAKYRYALHKRFAIATWQ